MMISTKQAIIILFVLLSIAKSEQVFLQTQDEFKTFLNTHFDQKLNVLLIGGGSRGDVQPVVGIGSYLNQIGCDCTIIASPEFNDLVTSIGCSFVPLGTSFKKMLQTDKELHEALNEGDIQRIFKVFGKKCSDEFVENGRVVYETMASNNFDVALATSTEFTAPVNIQQKFKIPSFLLSMQPFLNVGNRPGALFDPTAFSDDVTAEELEDLLATVINAWLEEQDKNLQIVRRDIFKLEQKFEIEDLFDIFYARSPWITQIGAFSPTVAQTPKDYPIRALGYIFQPTVANDNEFFGVSDELKHFMESGPAPIYLGWGSMCMGLEHSGRLTKLVVGALKTAGQRGVIFKGWQELDAKHLTDEPELAEYAAKNVVFLPQTNQIWLFARCKALMIHGGAGTTASAVRAGKPIIVSPYLVDQPWWAHQLETLGVGVKVSSINKITMEELASAITTVSTNEDMIEASRKLGAVVHAEKGLEAIVSAMLESVVDAKGKNTRLDEETDIV